MDLLLDQEIFKQFFFRNAAELLSERDVLLFNIFNNKNASIIINKQVLLDLLSQTESEDKKLIIKRYFDHLKKQSRILSIPNFNSLADFSTIQVAYQAHEDASQFLIIVSDEKDVTIDARNYIAIKDDDILVRNSSSYNIAQIAAHSRLTVRHLDFSNNTEIYNYFRQILNFVSFDQIIIIDRYLNFLKEWTLFERNRSYAIFENLRYKEFLIYTLNAEKNDFMGGSLNDFHVNVSTNITLFSTVNPNIIHERKLFFHHFILETDEDLTFIHSNRETWKVDIHYDKKTSEELQHKLALFTQYILD